MKKTYWISHRGLAQNADENTLAAFVAAHTAGFDAFETDLRVTKDDHLVLGHDPDFVRLGGPKLPIAEMVRAHVAKLEFARGGSPLFLDQLLERFPNVSLTLDIKPENGFKTIHALSTFIERHRLEGRIKDRSIRFLFWQATQQKSFTNRYVGCSTYARIEECRKAGLAAVSGMSWLLRPQPDKTYSLPYQFGGLHLFRSVLVDRFHDQRSKVLAFLPEPGAQTQAALDAGFDEILSNYPPPI